MTEQEERTLKRLAVGLQPHPQVTGRRLRIMERCGWIGHDTQLWHLRKQGLIALQELAMNRAAASEEVQP